MKVGMVEKGVLDVCVYISVCKLVLVYNVCTQIWYLIFVHHLMWPLAYVFTCTGCFTTQPPLSFHVTSPLPTLRALPLTSNPSYGLSRASHLTTSNDNYSSSTSASAVVTPAQSARRALHRATSREGFHPIQEAALESPLLVDLPLHNSL